MPATEVGLGMCACVRACACIYVCVCIDLLTCVFNDEGSSVTPEMLAISLINDMGFKLDSRICGSLIIILINRQSFLQI